MKTYYLYRFQPRTWGICLMLAVFLSEPAVARVVTDRLDRRVVVPDRVERLVALGPGCLRLVVYLGAADRVVGIEMLERRMLGPLRPYASVLGKRIEELPIVGQGGANALPDAERLIAARPDVIFVTSLDRRSVELIQLKTKLPVVALSYGRLGVFRDEAFHSLALLGDILGRQPRARQLIARVRQLEEDLRKRTQRVKEHPRVYVGGLSYQGGHGIESTEAGYPPLALLHGNNVADRVAQDRHLMIDREQLLAWNPEFLLLDINGLELIRADYQRNPQFYRSLRAVRAGKTYALLPYNYYNTNIETVYANAYAIGKWLYPGPFADVCLDAKTNEIAEWFVGSAVFEAISQAGFRYGQVIFDERDIRVR